MRNAILDRLVRNPSARSSLRSLLSTCNYGDWFLLFHLKHHMAYFPEWIKEVHDLKFGIKKASCS